MTTKILPTQRPSSTFEIPISLNEVALHLLPSILLVLALWLPFGFSLVGNIEEWNILGMFVNHGLFFITDASSPLPAHALRPLTILPQAIAYYLNSESFLYWNLLSALSLILKGACVSLLTKKIFNSQKWSIFAAILIIVYPADTMQLSFRSIHINWALSLLLLATVLQLKALSEASKGWGYAIVASAFLLAACSMYEASILLSPLPVLVLYASTGLKNTYREARTQILKHILWAVGVCVYVTYVIYTAPHVKSYQSNISGQDTLATLTHSFPHLFSIGLLRTVLGGWFDAVSITYSEFSNYWYAALVTISLVVAATFIAKATKPRKNDTTVSDHAVALRTMVVGALLTLLGYAPFLLSLSHQSISQRTFLFASLGGVLITSSALILIYRHSKTLSRSAAVALLFVGLCTQIFQFQHYANLGNREKQILSSIISKLVEQPSSKQLVILDKTNELNDTWMFLASNLRAALTYVYGHDFAGIQICRMPSKEWQQPDNLARKGNCEETSEEWVFHYPEAVTGPYVPLREELPDLHISKLTAIAIVVDPDNEADLPQNRTLIQLSSPHNTSRLAKVYRNVLKNSTPSYWMTGLADHQAKSSYHWNFGDWWSMELPIAGTGWRPAEWTVNNFHHDAVAWITSDIATLNFKFTPNDRIYRLSGEFTDFINSHVREGLTMSINGENVPITWTAPGEFSGAVPVGALRSGVNTLSIYSKTDKNQYGLSGRLTRFSIDNTN
ncbi:hypothetical protein ACIPO9_02745 [Pseudomonas sp. NPDC090203]|uniref:hypothetical protein n=1 Tax=Pseudomonas sp. NPDC090203 TaxID=3364477 RepID=UPI0038052B82